MNKMNADQNLPNKGMTVKQTVLAFRAFLEQFKELVRQIDEISAEEKQLRTLPEQPLLVAYHDVLIRDGQRRLGEKSRLLVEDSEKTLLQFKMLFLSKEQVAKELQELEDPDRSFVRSLSMIIPNVNEDLSLNAIRSKLIFNISVLSQTLGAIEEEDRKNQIISLDFDALCNSISDSELNMEEYKLSWKKAIESFEKGDFLSASLASCRIFLKIRDRFLNLININSKKDTIKNLIEFLSPKLNLKKEIELNIFSAEKIARDNICHDISYFPDQAESLRLISTCFSFLMMYRDYEKLINQNSDEVDGVPTETEPDRMTHDDDAHSEDEHASKDENTKG